MDKPNLDTLPSETLDGICSLLIDTGSLKSLRLACRETYIKTQDLFVKRHFTDVKAHLTRKDLKSLVLLLNNTVLGKAVRTLRLMPSCLRDEFDYQLFQSPSRSNDSTDDEVHNAIEVHGVKQEIQTEWRFGDEEEDMLVAALKGMLRLVRLDIGFKDPGQAVKHCSRVTRQQTHSHESILSPFNENRTILPASHGFAVVMAALTRMPRALKELHAGGGCYSLELDILQVPRMCRPNLLQSMSSITALSLGVDVTAAQQQNSLGGVDSRLKGFLSMLPELQYMSLSLRRSDHGGHGHSFISCEEAEEIEPSLRTVFHDARLPKLRGLKLSRACLRTTDLFSFLERHKDTIKTLALNDVWTLNYIGVKNSPPFAKALGDLLPKCPDLTSLFISRILTEQGVVLFEPLDDDCVGCAEPVRWDVACPHAQLKVRGAAVHHSDTAILLSKAGIADWGVEA